MLRARGVSLHVVRHRAGSFPQTVGDFIVKAYCVSCAATGIDAKSFDALTERCVGDEKKRRAL